MTLIRAEQIVGYEIAVRVEGGKWLVMGTHPVYDYTISLAYSDLSGALGYYVTQNYKAISACVMKEQRYRCLFCDGLKPLSIDHIIMRSHGRSDARSNLRGLCERCHRRRHEVPVARE